MAVVNVYITVTLTSGQPKRHTYMLDADADNTQALTDLLGVAVDAEDAKSAFKTVFVYHNPTAVYSGQHVARIDFDSEGPKEALARLNATLIGLNIPRAQDPKSLPAA